MSYRCGHHGWSHLFKHCPSCNQETITTNSAVIPNSIAPYKDECYTLIQCNDELKKKINQLEKESKMNECKCEGIVCYCRNKIIDDLQDKLYIESRRAEEIEYILNHKIEKLEQALAVAEDALHVCAMDKSCSRHTYQCCGHCRPIGEAEEALEKIKAIKEAE